MQLVSEASVEGDSADGGTSNQQGRMEQLARNPGPAGDAARTELARMNNGGVLPAGPGAVALGQAGRAYVEGALTVSTAMIGGPEVAATAQAVTRTAAWATGYNAYAQFAGNMALGLKDGQQFSPASGPVGYSVAGKIGYNLGYVWGATESKIFSVLWP